MKVRFISVLCLLTALLFGAPVQAPASVHDYVIGEGDVLEVAVWGVKELSFSARVRPDGKITVPGLGEISATGKTPYRLQQLLEESLKTLVKNPIVTVAVHEITNIQTHIFGGGVPSGIYDLTRRTTLLQLLCQISDFSMADLHRAYLLRGGEQIKFGFASLFLQGEATDDLVLESGDIIFIPPAAEVNVYVLGAVNSPRFVPFREGLTVMEAILEAGGFSKFARPNSTVILRKVGGQEKQIRVRGRDLVKGDLSQNQRLHVGDYVIVKEGWF
jgi:polysaccharide biosynthesis/export protein